MSAGFDARASAPQRNSDVTTVDIKIPFVLILPLLSTQRDFLFVRLNNASTPADSHRLSNHSQNFKYFFSLVLCSPGRHSVLARFTRRPLLLKMT
jgi:hypothetical protein